MKLPTCASFCARCQPERVMRQISLRHRCCKLDCEAVLAKSMWTRFTSLIIVLALAASTALGAPLHSSERGCNVSKAEMSDCELMGMKPSSPAASGIALCCLTDCKEPGPTETAFNLRLPAFNFAFVHPAALVAPGTRIQPLPQEKWLQSRFFSPPHTYLKNLALLI